MENINGRGTALQVMKELEQLGFRQNFEVRDRLIWCTNSDMTYGPVDVALEATFRFEGGTNPDDLAILYVFRCADGTGGFLMDAFGPNSDPDVSTFFDSVRDNRSHSTIMDGLPASKVISIRSHEPGRSTR